MTGTCYFLCRKCNGYFVNGLHVCFVERKMELEELRRELKNSGVYDQVVVANNGIFFYSDKFFLQVKDSFNLHHGVHSFASLGDDKNSIGLSILDIEEFPKLDIYDVKGFNWKNDLMNFKVAFKGLKIMLFLLLKYNVHKIIHFKIDKKYYAYENEDFKILIEKV